MRILAFAALIAIAGCSGSSGGPSGGSSSSGGITSSSSSSSSGGSTASSSSSSGGSANASSSSGGASSGSSSASPTGGGPTALDGTWLFTSGAISVEFTFEANGTYQLTILAVTSSATANETIQKGTFTATSNTITWTPQEETCPGVQAISSDTYLFVNTGGTQYLVATNSSGNSSSFKQVSDDAAALGSGLTIVLGCSVNG